MALSRYLLSLLHVAIMLVSSHLASGQHRQKANCTLRISSSTYSMGDVATFKYLVPQAHNSYHILLDLHCTTNDRQPLLIGANTSMINVDKSNISGVILKSNPLPCQKHAIRLAGDPSPDHSLPSTLKPRVPAPLLSFCECDVEFQDLSIISVSWFAPGSNVSDSSVDDGTYTTLIYLGGGARAKILSGDFVGIRLALGSVITVVSADLSVQDSSWVIVYSGFGAAAIWASGSSKVAISGSSLSQIGDDTSVDGFATSTKRYFRDRAEYGGAIVVQESSIVISNCGFGGHFYITGDGGVLSAAKSTVTIQNSSFGDRVAVNGFGGALYFDHCDVKIRNTSFDDCHAGMLGHGDGTYRGGAIYFSAFNATDYDASIISKAQSSLIVSNCTFDRNSADQGGAIFFVGDELIVDNCIFSDNKVPFPRVSVDFEPNTAHATGGAVTAIGNSIKFSHCTFTYNGGGRIGGAVALIGDFSINDQFTFTATRRQSTQITSCVFIRNSVIGLGSALYSGMANVLVVDSRFERNIAYSQTTSVGGSVLAAYNSSVDLVGCSAINNTAYASDKSSFGGMIYADYLSVVSLSSCKALGNKAAYGGLAYASDSSKVIVNGNSVLANNTAYVGGGVIWAIGSSVVNISGNTTCIGNTAGTLEVASAVGGGGVVCCRDSADVTIDNSHIAGNMVSHNSLGGGAFLLRDGCQMGIFNSILSGNSAQQGGGILVNGPAAVLSVSHSNISNNHASGHGGGISIIDGHVLVRNRTCIASNTAGLSGGGAYFDQDTLNLAELQAATIDNRAYPDKDISAPAVKLTFADDSPNKLDKPVKLAADGSLPFVLIVSSYQGLPCEGITVRANITYGLQSNRRALVGSVVNTSDADGGVSLQPHVAPGTYLFEFYVVANTTINASMNVSLPSCSLGQTTSAEGLCQTCPGGSYSTTQNSTCLPCPKGATCTGGAVMLLDHGYWRSSPLSDQIHRCPNLAACEGQQVERRSQVEHAAVAQDQLLHGCLFDCVGISNNFSIRYSDSLCSQGYHGNLCGRCASGYAAAKPFSCRPCIGRSTLIAVYVVGALALLGFIKLLCYFTIRETVVADCVLSGQRDTQMTDILKPFVLYLQYLLIVVSSNIEWPVVFSHSLRVLTWAFSSASPETLSADCLFFEGGLTSEVKRILFYLVAPVAMLVALLLIEMAVHMLPTLVRRSTISTLGLLDRVASNAIVVLFFFLPSLLRTTFSLFACIEIDKLQQKSSDRWLHATAKYWLLDVNQVCYGAWHKHWSLGLGIPMILVFCIALPVAVVLLVQCNKERLQSDPGFSRHYGFLYHTYKPSCCYWEGIVALQTAAFVAISVFGYSVGPYLQNLLLVLALVLIYMLLVTVQPYAQPAAQKAMVYGVTVVFFTAFAALSLVPDGYVQDTSTGDAYKTGIGIILVALNVSYVVYVCWRLFKVVSWPRVCKKLRVCIDMTLGRCGMWKRF